MHVHIAIYKTSEIMKALGCDEIKIAKLKTAISELGHNVIKYATDGTISFFLQEGLTSKIVVVVADKGPGIANIENALTDSFSTSGTLGLGLPGVRRMMDEFDIQTEIGKGTEVTIGLYI